MIFYPSRIQGQKDSGSRDQKRTGSRIRIRNTGWFQVAQPTGNFEHVKGLLPAPHPHILGVNSFRLSKEDFILTIELYNVVTDVLFSAKFVKQGVFNVVTISIFKSVLRIRDPEWKNSDPESGMEKNRIRDQG